jgi:hypothetical protein
MKKRTRPEWRTEAPAGENARRELPLMIERFLAEGDRAARANTAVEKLHEFRLSAKRLRYTLEAFRRLYGATLGKYLEAVRSVQTVLGELNDCRATRDLVGRLAAGESAELAAYLNGREESKRSEFRALWSARFGDPAFRRAFARYPAAYGRRRPSGPCYKERVLLGGRLMVGLQILALPIGVRVPASQPLRQFPS